MNFELKIVDGAPSSPSYHRVFSAGCHFGGIPVAVFLLDDSPLYWIYPDSAWVANSRNRGIITGPHRTFERIGPFDRLDQAFVHMKLLAD